jgi:hypothetical protein
VANVFVIIIESITIYLHTDSLGWLLLMLAAMFIEVMTILSLRKKKKNKRIEQENT